MTKWYKDIFPCRSCKYNGVLGTCYKGHNTTYVEGCKRCGIEVNVEWYYNNKKCKDFEYKQFIDPSGS